MKNTLLFMFILLFTSGIYAQDEVVFSTDRPGFCYSPLTVSKGRLLLETGLGLDLSNGFQNWGLAVHDFRYGVVKNFELKTGIRLNGMNTTNNLNELSLSGAIMAGLKWGIINKAIQLGYVAEVYIPMNPSIVFAQHSLNMAHGVGEVVGFNYVLQHGYDFSRIRGNRRYFGNFQFSWMVSFALMDRWSFYIEGTAQWESGTRPFIGVVYDAGFLYMIKDNLQLDFFLGHGINYSLGIYGIGLCWMPKVKQQKNLKEFK